MWESKPLCETFDFAHYKAIHRWLFEDLYEWAGEVRTIDLSKKGTMFCPAGEINRVAQAIFSRLKARSFWWGWKNRNLFCSLQIFTNVPMNCILFGKAMAERNEFFSLSYVAMRVIIWTFLSWIQTY